MASITTPPTTFRFLDLPPELRNNIYELAIADAMSAVPKELDILDLNGYGLRSPAVTVINRQVHHESHGYYKHELTKRSLFVLVGPQWLQAEHRGRMLEQAAKIPPLRTKSLEIQMVGLTKAPTQFTTILTVNAEGAVFGVGSFKYTAGEDQGVHVVDEAAQRNMGSLFCKVLMHEAEKSSRLGVRLTTRDGKAPKLPTVVRLLCSWIQRSSRGSTESFEDLLMRSLRKAIFEGDDL